MRIGRISLRWIKKNPWGRDIHPWEEITLDQLSPELRQLVTKMARVASRDFFEEVRETFWEAVSIELGKRIQDALAGVQGAPAAAPRDRYDTSVCLLCGGDFGELRPNTGPVHTYARHCDATPAAGYPGRYPHPEVNS